MTPPNDTVNREIPFNYTSADDARIVTHLLGADVWALLEALKFKQKTGRLTRLLMRFFGDMFILARNPFLYQDLLDVAHRRRRFFQRVTADLETVSAHGDGAEIQQILSACHAYLSRFKTGMDACEKQRQKIKKQLSAIVGAPNICLDPFTLISHATDATGWRLHLPIAVIRPETPEQVGPLVAAVAAMGLCVIPRGAGTGLTGGCVPVAPDCVMINTEKLNRIHGITYRGFATENGPCQMPVIAVEAGVVTESAMAYAAEKKLVFATDPTSAWACTIGGNIAENAGGKTAVLWGTAIDNLVSYRVVMPDGSGRLVRRLNHPARKILPSDTVRFEVCTDDGDRLETISLAGTQIRKAGLGKDITNKALNGLPGVQKEGTDGIITEAEFILYPEYACQRSFCIEFFGDDMEEAGRVIQALCEAFVHNGQETLKALEHFDEEYVLAIDYQVKAPRSETPKAVLLVDMVAHDASQLDRGTQSLQQLLSGYPNSHVFVADDPEKARQFWKDRRRLGAIAARTNAFKLNEDIVLPIAALAEFAGFVDRVNVEEDRYNQKTLVWQVGSYLESAQPGQDASWLLAKGPAAKKKLLQTLEQITLSGKNHLKEQTHLRGLIEYLQELFRGFKGLHEQIDRIHTDVRSRLIVIATHMHAGDGNVHVNIPVFPNDREMMIRAAETADLIMAKAVELGGVVSGEHGIGFTKFKHLAPEQIADLTRYRNRVDPRGVMNPGKLSDPSVPDAIFTPSFNLLGIEARILRHGSLEALTALIAKCIRCGKCKADCCVFFPEQNLFFHPRNKNLAIAALIEALLYETQRFGSTRLFPLRHLETIADHCTICHKCQAPCPVTIDTGAVSILEREILARRRYKHTSWPVRLSLAYLGHRGEAFNAVFRTVLLRWGSTVQAAGAKAVGPFINSGTRGPSLSLLTHPLPRLPAETLWKRLPAPFSNQSLSIEAPAPSGKTVFYFPGCGSERLFSTVGQASVFILLKTGAQVVLPPPHLCCGFPARVNASRDLARRQRLQNTILFTQIREMFAHLCFDACVISCGTCKEALTEIGVSDIFGCPTEDVSRWALTNGLKTAPGPPGFYHSPCHDSLEGRAIALLSDSQVCRLLPVAHCCGQAGTLALSRPDIAGALLRRKARAMAQAAGSRGPHLMLTNCPSCLQGLGRHPGLGFRVLHIAEQLAILNGGPRWHIELQALAARAEAITF